MKVKGPVHLLIELSLTATWCNLPYGITRCYCRPTKVNTSRHNPSQTGQYSIFLLNLPTLEGWKAELT